MKWSSYWVSPSTHTLNTVLYQSGKSKCTTPILMEVTPFQLTWVTPFNCTPLPGAMRVPCTWTAWAERVQCNQIAQAVQVQLTGVTLSIDSSYPPQKGGYPHQNGGYHHQNGGCEFWFTRLRGVCRIFSGGGQIFLLRGTSKFMGLMMNNFYLGTSSMIPLVSGEGDVVGVKI